MFLWQSKTAWEGVKFLFKIKNVSISWDALSRGDVYVEMGVVFIEHRAVFLGGWGPSCTSTKML